MRCGLAQLLPAAATKFRTGGSGFQRFLIPAETLFFSASKMLGNEIAFNLSGTSDVTLALVHSITCRYRFDNKRSTRENTIPEFESSKCT
ncbi:hypothetical protein ACHAXM_006196 [Skeletonema potamos]